MNGPASLRVRALVTACVVSTAVGVGHSQAARQSGPQMFHVYDGEFKSPAELVRVKVNSPVTVSFIDDAPAGIGNASVIALLPGYHVIMAGCPPGASGGNAMADRMAAIASEYKAISIDGRAGDVFELRGESALGEDASFENAGRTVKLPSTCTAQADYVTDEARTQALFAAPLAAARLSLRRGFLDDTANAADFQALQGRWRVTGLNMWGKDHTVEEYRRRAAENGGDAGLVDMVFEVKGARIKLSGPRVRGDFVITDLDAHQSPKRLTKAGVANDGSGNFAIYELQGRTLKYCYGAQWPKRFAWQRNPLQLSFVLERDGAEPAPMSSPVPLAVPATPLAEKPPPPSSSTSVLPAPPPAILAGVEAAAPPQAPQIVVVGTCPRTQFSGSDGLTVTTFCEGRREGGGESVSLQFENTAAAFSTAAGKANPNTATFRITGTVVKSGPTLVLDKVRVELPDERR